MLAGLGRTLDPARDLDDVVAGATVDIPLWMAHNLAARKLIHLMCAPTHPPAGGRAHPPHGLPYTPPRAAVQHIRKTWACS